MTSLVKVEVLRDRLRIDSDPEVNEDLDRIGAEASAIVVDYLKKPSHGWTDETVPLPVRTAILMVAQAMDAGEPDPLSRGVKDLLRRFRHPAYA